MTNTQRDAMTKVVEVVVEKTASYDVYMRVPANITQPELEEICAKVSTPLLESLNCDVLWDQRFAGVTHEHQEENQYESLNHFEEALQSDLHVEMIRDGRGWKAKFYNPCSNAVEEESV